MTGKRKEATLPVSLDSPWAERSGYDGVPVLELSHPEGAQCGGLRPRLCVQPGIVYFL